MVASRPTLAVSEAVKKQIFETIKKGEIDEVVKLIRETGVDIANLQDEARNFSQTPIFYAAIISNHESAMKMCHMLIEMGVNPIKEDLLKQSPLFYAAREGNLQFVQLLIEKGADVNRKDKYG